MEFSSVKQAISTTGGERTPAVNNFIKDHCRLTYRHHRPIALVLGARSFCQFATNQPCSSLHVEITFHLPAYPFDTENIAPLLSRTKNCFAGSVHEIDPRRESSAYSCWTDAPFPSASRKLSDELPLMQEESPWFAAHRLSH